MHRFFRAICVALILLTQTAEARTVQLGKQHAASVYGTEGWRAPVRQTILGRAAPFGQANNGTTGAFRFIDGVNAVTVFCIEPYSYLNLNNPFAVTENAPVGALIDRLFNSAFARVTDGKTAAGFQIALWEIIAETGNTIDVTGGNHRVETSAAAITAQGFLNGLPGASMGRYRYAIYTNSGQNQISAISVTLPASAFLLLGGLAGLAALRRKKT